MDGSLTPVVAIVDYSSGNLFSVEHACRKAGMTPRLTADPREILAADGVLLPGVGAFGEAMEVLKAQGLVEPLKNVVRSGKPLVGICLGMQLLLSQSEEFGVHPGLGIIEGEVKKFQSDPQSEKVLRVPHIGWSRLYAPSGAAHWNDPQLANLPSGEWMYFVHSYHAQPARTDVVLTESEYEGVRFCSSLRQDNVWGFQFHPEKSGNAGIQIYKNFATLLARRIQGKEHSHAA